MVEGPPARIRRGMTFGFHAPRGFFESAQAREDVDRMAELNVDTVCLVPTVMQELGTSTRQFSDFEKTSSDFELIDIIDYIHSKGMEVELRPMIESFDGYGRLQIRFPPDQDHRVAGMFSDKFERWFAGMRARSKHYAKLAQRTRCAVYCLESEVDHFVNLQTHWRQVVEVVREVFEGAVTSCHTFVVDFEEELQREDHWFRDLDYLEISTYLRSENKPGFSVEERVEFLQPALERFRRIASLYEKPIALGEFGCTSCTGAGMEPWDWRVTERYDGDEQANHLEAYLRLFWNEPWFAGLNWWKWREHIDLPGFSTDPAGDKGFPVWGKPAAGVMKSWFGREDRKQ